MNSNIENKKKLKLIKLNNSPKLILGQKLMSYVNFLHKNISEKEWSGILFYKVEGSINNINNMVLKANHFMLKDIGTAASTGYSFDESIIDYYDYYPETEDMKLGMAHTHHSMKNYFSGTDEDELRDNSEHHNYYLSVIFSYDCNYSAKLAIYSKGSVTKAFIKDDNGEEKEITFTEDAVIYTCDCKIEIEIDEYELSQYNLIKEKNKPTANINHHQGDLWGKWFVDKYHHPTNKVKTLEEQHEEENKLAFAFLTSLLTNKLSTKYTIDDLIKILQSLNAVEKTVQNELLEVLNDRIDACLLYIYSANDLHTYLDVAFLCSELLNNYPELINFEVSEILADYFDEIQELAQ
jgi:hypothetical protein